MDRLISIQDHSDWLEEEYTITASSIKWNRHRKRVEFGKQKLEIWMFVACKIVDGVWVEIKDPRPMQAMDEINEFEDRYEEYQEAKENCIFKGWNLENKSAFTTWVEKQNDNIVFTDRGKVNYNGENISTIEELVKYNLEITDSAKRQLGIYKQ